MSKDHSESIQSMGGKARAKSLSAERLSEIAKQAAAARWGQIEQLIESTTRLPHTLRPRAAQKRNAPMTDRVLRTKIILASTIEILDAKLAIFLHEQAICVGNYVDLKLTKLGNVYQIILIYAETIEC